MGARSSSNRGRSDEVLIITASGELEAGYVELARLIAAPDVLGHPLTGGPAG